MMDLTCLCYGSTLENFTKFAHSNICKLCDKAFHHNTDGLENMQEIFQKHVFEKHFKTAVFFYFKEKKGKKAKLYVVD